jgi:predicted transcriptional regulator
MKRNSLEICSDILKASEGGAKKTHIVYQANLNFGIIKRYLSDLTTKGFLFQHGDVFLTTEKGRQFIASYEALASPLSF